MALFVSLCVDFEWDILSKTWTNHIQQIVLLCFLFSSQLSNWQKLKEIMAEKRVSKRYTNQLKVAEEIINTFSCWKKFAILKEYLIVLAVADYDTSTIRNIEITVV